MSEWLKANDALVGALMTALAWLVGSLVGKYLPRDSFVGQVVRAWLSDLANKNLTTLPPNAGARLVWNGSTKRWTIVLSVGDKDVREVPVPSPLADENAADAIREYLKPADGAK